ncbi:hypothetical protein [Dyadobacter diqingensis]|uniref:hypothetical protein n=1 Tax=Dyadobacter diqingensis TaxID=2938121 RepID=UPI0020C562E8|nr:hypothetical protein [Dyadobacter diqingensis]
MRKLSQLFLTALLLAASQFANAQTNVGINNPTPNASAALDVTSTTQGMLVPRMTLAQRNLINQISGVSTPATGLLIYQTDNTPGFYFYNGSAWTTLTGTNGQGVPTGGVANQVLAKVDGTSYNTTWVTPASGSLAASIINTSTTLSGTNNQFIVASGAITITLPSAPVAGQQVSIFPETSPANINVNPNGKKFRQGGTDYDTSKLSDFGVPTSSTAGLTLIYSGQKWYPLSF